MKFTVSLREGYRFSLAHPLSAIVTTLLMAAIAMGDIMEVIPLFEPVTDSLLFSSFHETHTLLAVAVGLYAAYRWDPGLGAASILLFLALHIPYFALDYPPLDIPEILDKFVTIGVALFGIQLIDGQRRALGLARQREREISATAQLNLRVLNERVALLEEMTLAKQGLEGVLDAIQDGVAVIDENRMIVRANTALARMLGKPIDELVGTKICNQVHGRKGPIPNCPLEQALRLGDTQAIELREPHLGDKLLNISIFPMPAIPGEPRRFVHLFHIPDG